MHSKKCNLCRLNRIHKTHSSTIPISHISVTILVLLILILIRLKKKYSRKLTQWNRVRLGIVSIEMFLVFSYFMAVDVDSGLRRYQHRTNNYVFDGMEFWFFCRNKIKRWMEPILLLCLVVMWTRINNVFFLQNST